MISLNENRRMIEKIIALRHLPPDTTLPEHPDLSANPLLIDLLQLPDETDPFKWLQKEHSALISRALVWDALNQLNSIVRAASLAASTGYAEANAIKRTRTWLGTLSVEMTSTLLKLRNTSPTSVSGELLQQVYMDLREGWKGPERGLVVDSGLLFIEKLFSLDAKDDPLEWIERSEGQRAALITLRYLLRVLDSIPNNTKQKIVKVIPVHQRVHSGEFSVELNEIHFLEAGFIFFLHARFPMRHIHKPESLNPWFVEWEGIERVSDDLDYQYVIWRRSSEGGNRYNWMDLSLRLVGFPPFASRAREVTLNLNRMIFLVRVLENQTRKSIQEINLGDLAWKILI